MAGGLSLDASLGGAPAGVQVGRALDTCDRLLGEIGRREHRFAWLRDDAGDWLPLDAYYPGNRVVVVCAEAPEARRRALEAVPGHGLRLITIDPEELRREDHAAFLARRLRAAGWEPGAPAPPVASTPPPSPSPSPDRAEPRGGSAEAARAGAAAGARGRVERPAQAEERFGIGIGVALCAVVLLEAYLGAIVLVVGHGRWIVGFGVLLDACARVLGTIAAGHEGDHDLAWASLIVGSPAVVSLRTETPAEPARVAGAVALAALAVTGLGVITLVVGA
jgi:hypothetical protein